ncbi:uncharacterized protein [Nicotiana tomentosiformis]|uniref:uncharacterized protein n=1 Tax=Nicotiana tomentosiformis TaxID=4098 RepID=UPI00388C7539
MVIENHKFSDIIKLGERIEEGNKSGMVTNLEALQATNKALQSGGISKKKEVGAVMVAQGLKSPLTYQTPPPTYQPSPSRNQQPDATYHIYNAQPAYYHSPPARQNYQKLRPNFDRRLPRQYTPIAEPIDQLYERLKANGYVTLIPVVAMENSSQWINPKKTCAYHSGKKGHTIDECRTLKDKIQTLIDTKVIQAKEVAPIIRNNPRPDHTGEGYYVVEARRKGKAKMEETGAAQSMTRIGRVYTPEHLGGMSEEATSKPPVIDTGPDDLWRKVQAREYSVVDYLNKTPSQISILLLLQNSEAYRNALIKVLNEAYLPNNITNGEMANMVGQVLESHKITFHEDELPPEGLSHNRALHITVLFEDNFIGRVLIDGGSSLNICPLTTLKRLGKGMHEIRAGNMNVKAFDRSQRDTIGATNLSLQMAPTWFDVEFQMLDISATYNLLLGRPWIHAAGAITSTLH